MAKKPTQRAGKTLEQREKYHQDRLKRIALDRQIAQLRAQKKSLK